MLYCDGFDIRKGIDPTKSIKNTKWMICHYWFFNHGFNFQDSVCNDRHDLAMLIQAILLSLLLKTVIIVVLFITSANLKRLIY